MINPYNYSEQIYTQDSSLHDFHSIVTYVMATS